MSLTLLCRRRLLGSILFGFLALPVELDNLYHRLGMAFLLSLTDTALLEYPNPFFWQASEFASD